MSRFVVPQRAGLVTAQPEPPDGLAGRIVKYVPSDITAIFILVVTGLVSSKEEVPPLGVLALLIVFALGTLAYMAKRAPEGPVRKAHMLVSPLAFLAWGYVIASALLGPWFVGWIAFVAQGLVLLLAYIVVPSEGESKGNGHKAQEKP